MRPMDRKGQRCRVLARGKMNSALLEFEDGFRVVTSRNGLRRADRPIMIRKVSRREEDGKRHYAPPRRMPAEKARQAGLRFNREGGEEMPRVNSATKNRAGKQIKCGRCGRRIPPGEKYFHFTFRYGGKHVRCKDHYPRPSELTQSKMSGVYSAVESVEDVIADVRAGKADPFDLASALQTASEEVESVRDEYQESLDNMPEPLQQGPTGEEIQEKVDALDSFASNLSDAGSDIESEWKPQSSQEGKPKESETPDEESSQAEDKNEQAVDDLCQRAEDALSELGI